MRRPERQLRSSFTTRASGTSSRKRASAPTTVTLPVLVDQQPEEHPLREVRVLVLVDEDVLEAAPPTRSRTCGRSWSSPKARSDEVAEVERAALGQQPVVVRVEAGELELARAWARAASPVASVTLRSA